MTVRPRYRVRISCPIRALPLASRVDSLEAALVCRDNENPFGDLFVDLPFGRVNQLNGGLSLSQTVFAGGRVTAQARAANAGRRSSQIDLASANAQLVLDVTQAYYNALLGDHLLAIAEATMRQADTTLVQVRLARQIGDQPEFELLRAQVTRDNQRPVVIQQRADRDLAHIRLKQLLNLPLDEPVSLSTALEEGDVLPALAVTATETDTSVAARAPVRQASEALTAQEQATAHCQIAALAQPDRGFAIRASRVSAGRTAHVLAVPHQLDDLGAGQHSDLHGRPHQGRCHDRRCQCR